MKYAIVIPDGCADEPQEALGGRTPLQAARTPHMDALARTGCVGRSNNVPASLTPASDVATLSLFGYDPLECYTGRAPLEAAARGIRLGPKDWAIRCNLVTIEDGVMRDFTAGHISSEEARELIGALSEALGRKGLEFYPGVGYRNLLIWRSDDGGPFQAETKTQPPHDIPDQPIDRHLPRGPGADLLVDLMQRSQAVLAEHPVNQTRRHSGKRTATQVWLWGLGQAPRLESFASRYGPSGVIITGVDLVRGVGALLGWKVLDVPGVTDYLDNDYAAQGRAAVEALRKADLVCVHVEAPDEASHEGRLDAKIAALEAIDEHIVGPLSEAMPSFGDWRILVSPDHPTPVRTRAHAHGFVPWLVSGSGVSIGGFRGYDEQEAAASNHCFDPGWRLMARFLNRAVSFSGNDES
ncbi:MAG: cofactor-independent phosphoglycerate mutase [Gemmatales bacterium]|nr:cofactor-independent phosphoglycerate mutase [Gemmatales bacterium]MDW8386579.1 cofactor-independent phosphoglycerate mutase [Gemmatales bacterium]